MARILGALLAFALVFAIFKMVIVALVIAGLIFRTKETIALLLFGGLLTLLTAQPLVGFGLLAVVGVVALAKYGGKADAPDVPETDPPLLTDESQPGPT